MVKDPARTGRSDKPGKGSVIIGDEWAFSQYSDQEEMIRRISAIYVRTKSGNDERIRRILAHAANIGGSGVYVTASADLSQARNTADDSLTTLGLMIGVIALIVGGMSIANMMIVTVMEQRDEIGLRRALGAAQRAGFVRRLAANIVASHNEYPSNMWSISSAGHEMAVY